MTRSTLKETKKSVIVNFIDSKSENKEVSFFTQEADCLLEDTLKTASEEVIIEICNQEHIEVIYDEDCFIDIDQTVNAIMSHESEITVTDLFNEFCLRYNDSEIEYSYDKVFFSSKDLF